jgi:ABC-type sugar transport system permease subunit
MESALLKQGRYRKASRKKICWPELIFYVCLIILPLAQFCIFYIGVNFNSILLSFKSYDTLTGEYSWTLKNFAKVWSDLTASSILTDALVNSLIVWFFTVFVGTALAVIFSYYIYKRKFLSKTFKFILFLPSVLPSILLVMVYKYFVDEGLILYINEIFGTDLIGLTVDSSTRFPTVLFYCVWIGFGSQVLLYTGAMEQISPEINDALKVDGAGPMRELIHIVIPQCLPTISTFLISGIATIFTNQANLWSFFGGAVDYGDMTIGYYLFKLVNDSGKGMSEYPYASTLGLCCTFIALPLTFLANHFLMRRDNA